MSFFAVQANKGAINSIKTTTEGEISAFIDSLTTFATVGALNASLGDTINYVNAPYVAKERGIEIKNEAKSSQGGYKNCVAIKVVTDTESLSVSGTVFDEDVQRIVELNGFALDIEPKGRMILFKNTDVPGVIGQLGTILAKHNINIADFRLSRANGQALAVILVDDEVDKAVLDELKEIKAYLGLAYAVI